MRPRSPVAYQEQIYLKSDNHVFHWLWSSAAPAACGLSPCHRCGHTEHGMGRQGLACSGCRALAVLTELPRG